MDEKYFRCSNCHDPFTGAAWVEANDVVLHADCRTAWWAKKRGRQHKCPVCGGLGDVRDEKVVLSWRRSTSTDEDSIRAGMDGRIGPSHQPLEYGTRKCDFCDGYGYLEREPRKKMQFVGWEKG